jgi:hypothetical protein
MKIPVSYASLLWLCTKIESPFITEELFFWIARSWNAQRSSSLYSAWRDIPRPARDAVIVAHQITPVIAISRKPHEPESRMKYRVKISPSIAHRKLT